MKILRGKQLKDYSREELLQRLAEYETVYIDVGTGSGRYVLAGARKDRSGFYIGIDPVAQNMFEIATKAEKAVKKENLQNTLFVVASIEMVPDDLAGLADALSVTLPWGSLRDGIVMADRAILNNLRYVSRAGAHLSIVVGYDDRREPAEMQKRSLPPLSVQHFNTLLPAYRAAGFEITTLAELGNDELRLLESDWARRLAYGAERRMYRLEGYSISSS